MIRSIQMISDDDDDIDDLLVQGFSNYSKCQIVLYSILTEILIVLGTPVYVSYGYGYYFVCCLFCRC